MARLDRTAHAREFAARSGVTPRRAFNVLSELVHRGEARRISKGMYAPGPPPKRRELPSTPAMKRLARTIAQEMPALEPVMFSTGQVADLMHNAPAREIVVMATARSLARDLVRALSAAGSNAQVVSTRADMERLLDLPGQVLVAVLPVGDRRASKPSLGIRLALPERVFVDLALASERLGLPLYREDVSAVGQSLLANYDFAISRALDYARRRRGYEAVARILTEVVRGDPRLRPYEPALP